MKTFPDTRQESPTPASGTHRLPTATRRSIDKAFLTLHMSYALRHKSVFPNANTFEVTFFMESPTLYFPFDDPIIRRPVLSIPFDDPIAFHGGRVYKIGEWSCESDYASGLRILVEVARVDMPHHSYHYPSWGDWFSFNLHFPDSSPTNERLTNQALIFTRLWISRHLRENPGPRGRSCTEVTIEGSFAA